LLGNGVGKPVGLNNGKFIGFVVGDAVGLFGGGTFGLFLGKSVGELVNLTGGTDVGTTVVADVGETVGILASVGMLVAVQNPQVNGHASRIFFADDSVTLLSLVLIFWP
jgi:hypothetical protein